MFSTEYWQFRHPIALNTFGKLTLRSSWVSSDPEDRKNENKRGCINKKGHADPCSTQPTFTCSKLTIEALEQGVKYVQS